MEQSPDTSQPTTTSRIRSWVHTQLSSYSLLNTMRGRRSRRFGWGMHIPEGPLTYTSAKTPESLTEDEEAALVFAASGITGHALADLSYGEGQGGGMLSGLIGRTIASPDSVNAVALIVTNDNATYFIKRPQDYAPADIPRMIEASQHLDQGETLTELYRTMRVKLCDHRTKIPVIPGNNYNINRWSAYAAGGTYFLPINEISGMMINALIEAFDPKMGLFIIDERNRFAPAGIGKFAKSRGGHLDDGDFSKAATVQGIEMSLTEAVAVEQGMMLQNLGLMAQALGLGGFPNYARAEFAWFPALGFKTIPLAGSVYAGAAWWMSLILKLLKRDIQVEYPVGLENNGEVLMHAYCPPYYKNMTEAVYAWVDRKFGANGIYRGKIVEGDWRDPQTISAGIAPPDPRAVEATAACCEYLYQRYKRFPSYAAPFRTVIGYQATRVDVAFYDKFYRPDALTETQRNYPLNA